VAIAELLAERPDEEVGDLFDAIALGTGFHHPFGHARGALRVDPAHCRAIASRLSRAVGVRGPGEGRVGGADVHRTAGLVGVVHHRAARLVSRFGHRSTLPRVAALEVILR